MKNSTLKSLLLSSCLLVVYPCMAVSDDDDNLVSATGVGVVERKPSHIHITLGVDVNADSVSDASSMLSGRSSKVVDFLKDEASVTAINTSNMRIYTNYRNYEKKNLKEYNASLTISFNSDIESAPKLIEKSLLLGANRINGYEFQIGNKEMQQMQKEAISLATKNAISEINASLKAADLKIKSIHKISVIPSNNFHHRYESAGPMMLKASGGASPAPIESSGLSVERQVQVTANYSD